MALAAAAGAEAEGQVVALLGPHVLAALLLVPAPGPADAVELDQDAALPLVEALQVHPGAVRAVLVVAHHLLVVVFLQVHRPPEAADQRRRTRGFWGEAQREREIQLAHCAIPADTKSEIKAHSPSRLSPFTPKVQHVSGVEIPTTGITPDRVRKRSPLSFGGMLCQGNLFCDICYQLKKPLSFKKPKSLTVQLAVHQYLQQCSMRSS